MKRIMLFGLGTLGSRVLDILSRQQSAIEIMVCVRNPKEARAIFNTSYLTALHLGYRPLPPTLVQLDLLDEDKVSSVISDFKPDVIFSAVSLQSWWVTGQLPGSISEQISAAEVGPWLPMHLSLTHHLMRAVRASGTPATVVNSSFPDVVHPVLDSVGLSPTVGIGNVANNIPALTVAAADQLGCSPDRVTVRLVMHHFASHRISRLGGTSGAPYRLSVEVAGNDRTDDIDNASLFKRLPDDLRRLRGRQGTAMTAASAASVLNALVEGSDKLVHAPGPNGLPGGYPIRFSAGRPHVDLPANTTFEEAVKINLDSHQFEGIDNIDHEGTVQFTKEHSSVLAELLNYECDRMRLEDCDSWASELGHKYQEFQSRVLAGTSK